MNRRNRIALSSLVLAAWVTGAAFGAPLTTKFTYQGTLKLGGLPVSGTADMVFTLWNASSAGVQSGPTLTFDGGGGNPAPVTIVAGVFQVELDFGAGAFDGNERWLAISVRQPAGAGAYVALTPRQHLTAAPYALFAASGAGANLWASNGVATYNTADTFVGINRSARVTSNEYFGVQAPINSGYGGMYIRTDGAAGVPFYGYSNGAASAWTSWDGSSGKWQVYNGGARLTITDAGDVGIGTTAPGAKLDVVGNGGNAIEGSTTAATSYGVWGSGTSAGVYGTSGASNGAGVYGENNSATGTGVEGHSSGAGGAGMAGYSTTGTGVYGSTWTGYAIYGSNGGSNSSGYAGYFNGRVHVNGTLSKSGGSFKIDHPLDPANKYLSHSFVESPEMMNIYNGNVTTDAQGYARVTLPDWFEALNRDFRYQLTVLDDSDEFVQAKVVQEVRDNEFVVRTSRPATKVSWQVTGVRHDAWAEAHPIPTEENKVGAERGKYLHPELFGMGKEYGLFPEIVTREAPTQPSRDR